MSAVVVFCTAGHPREARRLARTLLRERLAACVSFVPRIRSVYRWKGKVEEGQETLLMIKTARARYPALERRLRALHSYDVPEILALPVARGSRDYLRWLAESVRR